VIPDRPSRYGVQAVGLLVVALTALACGGQAARVPPLPPPPHLSLHGPAVSQIQRAGLLRVASDLSYPPMEFLDGRVPRGFEIDLASLLAAALGVRLQVIDTPVAVIRAGFPPGVDMIVSALSPDRAPGLSSDPYYVLGQAILSRQGEPVRSSAMLRGLRVAVQAGSPGAAIAEEAGATALVATYQADQALSAVASGRVQAAIGDRPSVVRFAKTHADLRVTPVAGYEVPLVIVVRSEAPDLAEFVSQALHELETNGGLGQLRKRWDL
jgi:polar amino acid transport system substrate-binding protein